MKTTELEAATLGPDAGDVADLAHLFGLMRNFLSDEQRARFLLTSNWMRERGAEAGRINAEQLRGLSDCGQERGECAAGQELPADGFGVIEHPLWCRAARDGRPGPAEPEGEHHGDDYRFDTRNFDAVSAGAVHCFGNEPTAGHAQVRLRIQCRELVDVDTATYLDVDEVEQLIRILRRVLQEIDLDQEVDRARTMRLPLPAGLTPAQRRDVADVGQAVLAGLWQPDELQRLMRLGTPLEVAQEARRRLGRAGA